MTSLRVLTGAGCVASRGTFSMKSGMRCPRALPVGYVSSKDCRIVWGTALLKYCVGSHSPSMPAARASSKAVCLTVSCWATKLPPGRCTQLEMASPNLSTMMPERPE